MDDVGHSTDILYHTLSSRSRLLSRSLHYIHWVDKAYIYHAVKIGKSSFNNKAYRACSVAVPPTLHVIFILTATPLFLLVAVAIGLEYNAAQSGCRGWRLSRLAVSLR